VSRRDRQRLDDIQAALDAIDDHLTRGGLSDGPHDHPDSVMVTLSSFTRRLHADGTFRDVQIAAGGAHWLPAQQHHGQNTGDTDTHVIFVELKTPPAAGPASALGPQ
jgi:redox-sensitive bicupin YhaK (pirin superfamily)